MRMTPGRMLLMRAYVVTLGRFELCERIVRRVLVTWLIRRRPPAERYVSSSRYFDMGDLNR